MKRALLALAVGAVVLAGAAPSSAASWRLTRRQAAAVMRWAAKGDDPSRIRIDRCRRLSRQSITCLVTEYNALSPVWQDGSSRTLWWSHRETVRRIGRNRFRLTSLLFDPIVVHVNAR